MTQVENYEEKNDYSTHVYWDGSSEGRETSITKKELNFSHRKDIKLVQEAANVSVSYPNFASCLTGWYRTGRVRRNPGRKWGRKAKVRVNCWYAKVPVDS